MAKEYVKRFVTKDENTRINIYREECAENPRYMWDFPLHCEDWSRGYSIMNKQERETKSENARDLIEYLLKNFGDGNKIISLLVENGKHLTDGKSTCNNALVYDRSAKRWVLKEYTKWYGDKDFEWKDAAYFDCKRDNIDVYEVLECVIESTIDFFVEQNCLTDKVKVMSYSFGYYGEISFYREFSTDSEGIAWLEKDEALKDWIKEEYWDKEDCYDLCDGMRNELEAWSNNEVYGFVVEDAVRIQGIKTYYNGEREDEPYIDTQWEESDSCWGFYGDICKEDALNNILDGAGYKKEELIEEA